MSSAATPLATRLFLIILAAYSSPVFISIHFRTIANCPLKWVSIRTVEKAHIRDEGKVMDKHLLANLLQ